MELAEGSRRRDDCYSPRPTAVEFAHKCWDGLLPRLMDGIAPASGAG